MQVRVETSKGDRVVTFGLVRLEAIEKAVGRNVGEILLTDVAGLAGDSAAGPAPEMARAVAKRISAGFVSRFLSGCLEVPPDQVEQLVPLQKVFEVFTALLTGFVEAVRVLIMGEAEATPKNPPSAGSEPGPESSSA